jgi:hypothetical protein
MIKNPMQPVVVASDGAIRFKSNKVVEFVLANSRVDLNDIAIHDFSQDDREQFAQLIGYSVSGYGELSYVSDKSYNKAAKQAEKLAKE